MRKLLHPPVAFALGILGLARLCAAEPVPFPHLAEPEPEHTSPVLLTRVEPLYPSGVHEPREHRIYVAFHVAADGRVRNAAAMFNPPPEFAHAAVKAVEQWTFKPGMIHHDKPVWTQMTVELPFKPGETPAAGTTVAREVLATHERMVADFNRLDVDAFYANVVESDESRIAQDGTLFPTRAAAVASVREGVQRLAGIARRFDEPHVTLLAPDVALLTATGTTDATLTDGRTVSSAFALSSIFVRRDGRWVLFHGHYSMPDRAP